MGMLDRYRKSGGFIQLLTLVETCVPAKQEKFLEIIRSEDGRWSDAIRAKMIDIHRVFSWNDEALAEIIGSLQDLTIAILLHWAPDPIKERMHGIYAHSRRRKIDDLFESNRPGLGDIIAAHVKVIETVRMMVKEGHLRFEKFAPELIIEDNIEDKLAKGALSFDLSSTPAQAPAATPFRMVEYTAEPEAPARPVEPVSAVASAPEPSADTSELEKQVVAFRRRIMELTRENSLLRQELANAQGKLEQIRKIA